MLSINAIEGQSILDVCLQTYGTLDYLLKLIQDNDFSDVNSSPVSGQSFAWDETLSADQRVNQITNNQNIKYATKVLLNGSVLSVVQTGISPAYTGGNYYQNQNPESMVKYEETKQVYYIAAGGENTFILSDLIGCTIIQVTREVQPLKTSEYAFNSVNGQVTLSGNALLTGETVYIIYSKIINE